MNSIEIPRTGVCPVRVDNGYFRDGTVPLSLVAGGRVDGVMLIALLG